MSLKTQQSRAQRDFLNNGGVYRQILEVKWEKGELVHPDEYEHQEYPKALNVSLGIRTFQRTTGDIKNRKEERTLEWEDEIEVRADLIVNSEEEEEETLAAVDRARELCLEIQPDWAAETLRWNVKMADRQGARLPRPKPLPAEQPAAAAETSSEQTALVERIAALEADLAALASMRPPQAVPEANSPHEHQDVGETPQPPKPRSRGAAALAASAEAE